MDLAEAFRNYREKIVDRWVEYTLSTYASPDFFKGQKDRFANPVGTSIRESLTQLFDMLISEGGSQRFRRPVESFVRIRAVQEFTPAQAVAPLHGVKHITREVLAADKERSVFIKDLYDFEFNVDLAVLLAFDLYMESRERLYQVRISELKSGSHILTDATCPSKLMTEESQDN
ncbi:MAG: RsbRD N-terminal domain-containing protein [Desulfopila sp.]